MNSKIITTATALVAGAALVTWYIKKRKAAQHVSEPAQRPAHHLTNVFARAKDHAVL